MNKKTLITIALVCFFGLAVTASASHAPTNLVIVKNSAKTVTVGWAAVPGVTGYGLFVDGTRVATAGAAATQAKFGTPQWRRYVLGVSALKTGGATSTITVDPKWVVVSVDIPPEPTPAAACADGLDNDGDGKIDFPADPGCTSAADTSEVDASPPPAQCADGLDNDGDGKVDLADPGCSSASDNDETDTPPNPSPTCNLQATTSNFAAQISAATAGQTVCLASGNYGTWGGTNKAIDVAGASGASPQMSISFGTGDTGFTLTGMTGMSGGISSGATNITIRNSTFTGVLNISGSGADGIVLDGNTHNWNVGPSSGGPNAKIYLENSLTGTLASPSVTIRNSQIKNGDLDGIHFGGGSGYQILNNVFDNLCDRDANHTDNMQFDTSPTTNVRIAGNYVHAVYSCGTQGITSYDHGTTGNVIVENNVVDIHRPWGIELYADVGSVVRHNTVVYYPSSDCYFNTPCGKINVTNKSGDPVSSGTQVYDNLAIPDIGNCNGCSQHHNTSANGAIYVGPTNFHDGFLLAPTSPVGRGGASDGSNLGVYANGG